MIEDGFSFEIINNYESIRRKAGDVDFVYIQYNIVRRTPGSYKCGFCCDVCDTESVVSAVNRRPNDCTTNRKMTT